MKHVMGKYGATIPVNFQDDYTYELMHPMVGSGAYIAITKGLNKNGGNLAVGHIWPRERKLNLHNSKTGHTISEENLNKLYDLADSLQDYTFGTFDDIDVPDFYNEMEYKFKSNPIGIENPADYMSKVTFEKDTDNDGDMDTKVTKTKVPGSGGMSRPSGMSDKEYERYMMDPYYGEEDYEKWQADPKNYKEE